MSLNINLAKLNIKNGLNKRKEVSKANMWTTVISIIALVLALVANAVIIATSCIVSHQCDCDAEECKICGKEKDPTDQK